MSLRFSRITLSSNEKAAVFLVGGIPENQSDLQGWTAFREFIEDVRKDDAIVAHVETFLYGGEEPVDATPEEVAYIYQRVSMRPDFIEKRTEKCGETDLVIWGEK